MKHVTVGMMGLLLVISGLAGAAELEVMYEWVTLQYIRPEGDNETHTTENDNIAGIKVYDGTVYVTVPRWLPGVYSTLNKVVIVDNQPFLEPYPSLEMQEIDNCVAFQNTLSMEVDPITGHMWVIDMGRREVATEQPINACPAKVVIIDLNTDEILHWHEFPDDVLTLDGNLLADIVLDPGNGYAYMSDVGTGPPPDQHLGGLIVYNYNTGMSHRLEHESMLPEPDAVQFHINGSVYLFNTPIDGIALSPDKQYIHYCPLGGYNLYQLPTSDARNPEANLTAAVRHLGAKPSQSDGLLMGHKRLYYGCLAGSTCQSALAYWPYQEEMNQTGLDLGEVTMEDYVIFHERDDVRTMWADTFAMDDEGYLWVVTNRMNMYFAGELDLTGNSGSNFRIVRYPFPDDRSYLYPLATDRTGYSLH